MFWPPCGCSRTRSVPWSHPRQHEERKTRATPPSTSSSSLFPFSFSLQAENRDAIATIALLSSHVRIIALQPTKSRPQLRHHLMNLIDHSIGAAELRVSGIADFPRSEFTEAPSPSRSSMASTAQHSSIPSHPRLIFLMVYRSLGEDVITWFEP
jgi:hypothetical protein